jgi:hypothetical protein
MFLFKVYFVFGNMEDYCLFVNSNDGIEKLMLDYYGKLYEKSYIHALRLRKL